MSGNYEGILKKKKKNEMQCHISNDFYQGQGIVRELGEPSGKFENIGKCQGIMREFWKKMRCNAIYLMISTNNLR